MSFLDQVLGNITKLEMRIRRLETNQAMLRWSSHEKAGLQFDKWQEEIEECQRTIISLQSYRELFNKKKNQELRNGR